MERWLNDEAQFGILAKWGISGVIVTPSEINVLGENGAKMVQLIK